MPAVCVDISMCLVYIALNPQQPHPENLKTLRFREIEWHTWEMVEWDFQLAFRR